VFPAQSVPGARRSPSPCWLRLGAYLLLGVGAAGCTPPVSRAPLYNSEPEGAEQYFYGPALAQEHTKLLGSAPAPAPNPFTRTTPSATARAARSVASNPSTEPPSGDAGTDLAMGQESWVGEYRGTDHVTIHLPGVPKTTADDPKARARVADARAGSFSVAVLDSSNGSELCVLVGTRTGSRVQFEPGQACFDDVLGFDASTELKHGYAALTDDQLTIDFEVTIEALDADVTGSLLYRFEGTRD
jgi:hypothetical protein